MEPDVALSDMADGMIYVLRFLNEAEDGVFDTMNSRRELANLNVEKGRLLKTYSIGFSSHDGGWGFKCHAHGGELACRTAVLMKDASGDNTVHRPLRWVEGLLRCCRTRQANLGP